MPTLMPIKTEKAKILRLSFPIEKIERDGDTLTVSGPCFVNEDVGRGAKIKRSAMEAATEDYMRWGAVREMHQPSAVGTALDIVWQDDGAYLRAKIVDAAAIQKVEEGVYKAYSIGITPRVMRGDWVVSCDWVEVSLVDRPADPDCPIEVERLEDGEGAVAILERASFSEYVEAYETGRRVYAAYDWLWSSIYDIRCGDAEDKARLIRQTCSEFAEYIAPLVEAESSDSRSILEVVSRLEEMEAADTELSAEITRLSGELETREAAIEELRRETEAKDAEISRLKDLPARIPVKGGVPREVLERKFAQPGESEEKADADALREEYRSLAAGEKGAGEKTVARMLHIKDQLAQMGEPLT